MARRRSWQWSLPGIVLVALLATFFNLPDQAVTHGDFEVVERVVDSDTLLLASGERVHLIGVDTPETKHPNKPVQYFGEEASASGAGSARLPALRTDPPVVVGDLGHPVSAGLAYRHATRVL